MLGRKKSRDPFGMKNSQGYVGEEKTEDMLGRKNSHGYA